jgi:hypothetical protein
MKSAGTLFLVFIAVIVAFVAGRITASYEIFPTILAPSKSSSSPSPVIRRSLPEPFKSRLNALMESASKLSSATKVGLNLQNFGESVRQLQGNFDLADVIWPSDELRKEREDFEDIIVVYRVLYQVWQAKIGRDPSGVMINDISSVSGRKILEENPFLETEKSGAGVMIKALDSNISVLMTEASERISLLQPRVLHRM